MIPPPTELRGARRPRRVRPPDRAHRRAVPRSDGGVRRGHGVVHRASVPRTCTLRCPASGVPPRWRTWSRRWTAWPAGGNLGAGPDTARVTAVEDFFRKRSIYQLTRAGEAAEEDLAVFAEALLPLQTCRVPVPDFRLALVTTVPNHLKAEHAEQSLDALGAAIAQAKAARWSCLMGLPQSGLGPVYWGTPGRPGSAKA
ncbi:DUF2397 family protein [Streptomyces sp. NPDC051453]|uniref:DUF2397 family protein n=1 Tax=Streptomyces sp. NPDC051453 TaxID=3154941 RepID=UPI00341B279C